MKIFGFFNSMEEFGDAEGIALSEDGEVVATHVSSSESFSKYDLNKPKLFDSKYPKGWEFEFVKIPERDSHTGLQSALKAYDARYA